MAPPRLLSPALAVAALLALGRITARGDEPPGTPPPSAGAPGGAPGRTDPFGAGGGEALKAPTRAEEEAAQKPEVLEAIEIVGNERVSAARVRDHLSVREGDVLTPGALLESRIRLFQIGAFSRVDLATRPGTAPGRAVLVVDVDELYAVTFANVAFAQTPVSRPYGGLEIGVRDVAGLPLGASVGGAVDGHGRWSARLTLYEPDYRAAGRSWIGGVRLLAQDGLESGCATPRCNGQFSAIPWLHYQRIGGEADLGIRPGAFSRFLLGYRFDHVRSDTDPGVVPEALPYVLPGRSRVSALVVAWDFDSRTESFLPTDGWRVAATVTIGTAALGSDYEYSRYLLELERWVPRTHGRGLRFDLALGLVQGDAPFFDRFYAADWSYFSVGLAAPRVQDLDFSPDSRYDTFLAVAGAEYDFSLWRRPRRLISRGILALGLRGVLTAQRPAAARTLVSQVPLSIDVSVRVDTRYGSFGIGLGYVIDQILKALALRIPAVQQRG